MAKRRELKESGEIKFSWTDRRREFCHQYLIDHVGSKAAVRAGFAEDNSKQIASELLEYPEIQTYIQELMDDRAKRTAITADKVLINLWEIADLDIGDAYDENGRLLNVKDMPKHVRKAISSIKVFEEFEGFGADRIKIGEVREVKFWDKKGTNELIGKHLKIFADKLEIEDVTKGKVERLAAARKRLVKKDD